MMGQFGEPATILRAGTPTQDDFGNSVPGPDTETVIPGCSLAPGTSAEQTQFQDVLTIDADLYLPPGTDVTATDRIRFRGTTYEIDGEPDVYRSPLTGTVGPVAVHIRKVS